MDVEAERQQLLAQICQHAEAEYRAGATMVTRTQLKVYGVRVPHLRQIARDWQRAHKQVTHEDLMALVEMLWNGESQEERLLAIELLGRYRRRIPDLTWDRFDRWRRKVDNWGLTDALGTGILGPWLLADPEGRLDYLRDLIADEEVWSRRLALVATVPINRGHTGFTIPDLTLELIDRVKAGRHPMITKAVSWALRERTKTHPARVSVYLEENRDVLAAHVVREVSNKLRTGLKRDPSGFGKPKGSARAG
jgi:3-methyladenine DNA glycosylase AlkD